MYIVWAARINPPAIFRDQISRSYCGKGESLLWPATWDEGRGGGHLRGGGSTAAKFEQLFSKIFFHRKHFWLQLKPWQKCVNLNIQKRSFIFHIIVRRGEHFYELHKNALCSVLTSDKILHDHLVAPNIKFAWFSVLLSDLGEISNWFWKQEYSWPTLCHAGLLQLNLNGV